MISKSVVINIPSEQEARPIAMLVQTATQYESKIYIEMEDKKVNAKSIMGMMSLKIASGEEVKIVATGKDEENAVDEIERYLTTV